MMIIYLEVDPQRKIIYMEVPPGGYYLHGSSASLGLLFTWKLPPKDDGFPRMTAQGHAPGLAAVPPTILNNIHVGKEMVFLWRK